MKNKPETVFVVMEAGNSSLHAVHKDEAEAKNSVVAFANAVGFPMTYEEYSLGSPLAWSLSALDLAKERVNDIMQRRKSMKAANPAAEEIHLEGMGQAWGLIHELRDELIDKKFSVPCPRRTELKEAALQLDYIDLTWLETQCGSHLTVKAPDLLRLLKAVKAIR